MKWLYLVFMLFVAISCSKEEEIEPLYVPQLMEVPKGFPTVEHPDGNEFTEARWTLGKRLFYETALSVDSSVSCASCHQASLAFSDDGAFSLGVEDRIGTRNSPSLANIAYHPYFTREGGVPTLEMQVLVPIQEHNEFDFNIVLIVERLQKDSTYVKMAQQAYGREIDAFIITRAIACFERSILSGYSPFDQYKNYDKPSAISESAIRGMNLFYSDKTKCSNCHDGFNFTNYTFKNNGLYEVYKDEGRYRLTREEADRALFKVPGLRNVERTAPYMHDGSLQTLEAVIDHYDLGGKNHPQKSELIQPLNLTNTEKDDLVSFLKSLTDEAFINNPLFKK
jgi:cytochrome c peroxidase